MKFLVDVTEVDGDSVGGGCLYIVFGAIIGFITYSQIHGQPWTHSTLGRIGEVLAIIAATTLGPILVPLAIVAVIVGFIAYWAIVLTYAVGHWVIVG